MKNLLKITAIVIVILSMISCGKEQVREPAKVGDDSGFITVSNGQLAKYPVTGFAYKSAQIPSQEWNNWARMAAPVVKNILNKLPAGYVLEVRGHADASGPEQPEGNKPGNLNISRDRAQAVIKALASAGLTSSKITYKGVGSAELLPKYDSRSGQQRRVTFAVVPK